MNRFWWIIGFFALLSCEQKVAPVKIKPSTEQLNAVFQFGIRTDTLDLEEKTVKSGSTLVEMLQDAGFSKDSAHRCAEITDTVFDLRKIKAGEEYSLLKSKTDHQTKYLVYNHSLTDYLLLDFSGKQFSVQYKQKQVDTALVSIEGKIDGSLSETVEKLGAPNSLTNRLVGIFDWTVDFFKIQEGDYFKVTYQALNVDGKVVSVGAIPAAQFYNGGKLHKAFYFPKTDRYYDESGNAMRKKFLKSPLDYTRISSRFSMARFHPVLKRWKPHFGVDYSAPVGTPIRSIGDGVVEAAGYKSMNGNYVKVKHNGRESTQYLHMSRIAKGMRNGKAIKQGEVIGYVGATGLATGPHLCLRFWLNGKQVDPLKMRDANEAIPLPKADLPAFLALVKQYNK